MNGIQAVMLAATPVDSSLVVASQSSQSSIEASPAGGSFEKQLKKAYHAQREKMPFSGVVKQSSEPIEAEISITPQEAAVDRQDTKPSTDSQSDEGQNTDNTYDANTPNGAAMAQVLAMPFIGSVKNTAWPQDVQEGVICTTTASTSPEIQSANTGPDLSRLANLQTRAGDAGKTDDSINGPAVDLQLEVFKVDVKDSLVKEQIQNSGNLVTSREAGELQVEAQVKDNSGLKNSDGEAKQGSPKLAEFESQRAFVLQIKDSTSSASPLKTLPASEQALSSAASPQDVQEGMIETTKDTAVRPEVQSVKTAPDPAQKQAQSSAVLQQDVQEGMIGTTKNTAARPEVQSVNTASDLAQEQALSSAVLQQDVQEGMIGTTKNTAARPGIQPVNTASDLALEQALNSPASQQDVQEGMIGTIENTAARPEVQAVNTALDLSKQTVFQTPGNNLQKPVGEKVVPIREQIQNDDILGASQEADQLRVEAQAEDVLGLKKTDGEVSHGGKNLVQFESQRASVVHPVKDSSLSKNQDQSSYESEEALNSTVLQQVEVKIPKFQVLNDPRMVQNSRGVVDPQDLMDQMVKKAAIMVKDNNSEMTLQLKPDLLGKMTIKIAVDHAGTVTAHFTTNNQQVKNILDQNIQTLRQTLEAQGMKVDRTEVNVQLDSGGMMNDPGGRQQEMWQQPGRIQFKRGMLDTEGDTTQAAGQIPNVTQSRGYETVETNDNYNFLV